MRTSKVIRKTNETDIKVKINLDGKGKNNVDTPIGFFNHMLENLARHSLIDLEINAAGDIATGAHHIIEDIGIVLGTAMNEALSDKKGINRYGYMILPMDEVLALCSIDISGRYSFSMDAAFRRETVGDLPTELVYEFFDSLAQNARMNLHIKLLNHGRNDHHRIEAIFKAFARSFRKAAANDPLTKNIPSTKGEL